MESLNENEKLINQRNFLLPWWIKLFGIIYFFYGLISLPIALFTDIYLSTFGIEAQSGVLSLELIILVSLNLFLAITAFGLLRGETWGLNACIANGYIGIAICLVVSFLNVNDCALPNALFEDATACWRVRLEPIIQVLFLLKLYKIKRDWFAVNKKFNKQF